LLLFNSREENLQDRKNSERLGKIQFLKMVNRGQGETTWQERMNAVKYNSGQTFFENVDRKI